MKKLLSLVLVCAMGLGMVSCVESEESPSVEAIRNAKAEQLKALSNLYNAQAEAAKITANAEAALLNAKAEYQKALADSVAQSTEQAKAKFAVEIEKIKAEAEADILKAKKNAELYQQQILTQANTHVNTLYNSYIGVLNSLTTKNGELVNANIALTELEAGVISAEKAAKVTIAEQEKYIASYKAQIEVLKDTKYTEVNADSIYVLWQAAIKKAEIERDYFNKSEVKKAVDKTKETAILAAGDFKTMKDEVTAKSWNLLIEDNDDVNDWEFKQLNPNGTIKDWAYTDVVRSITISEVKVNEHKNNLASSYKTAVETYETAQEELDNAKVAAETAKAYAEEIVPVADANEAAALALFHAWEKYDAIAGLDAEVERLEGELEDLEEELEELVEAQDEAKDKLDEIGAIQPDLKVLTDAAAAAKATYEDKVEAVTDAGEVVTEAKDAWAEAKADAEDVKAAKGETSVEYAQALVLVAQANTVVTQAESARAEAIAAQTEAKAEWDEAEAEVTAFVAEIAADYPTIDLTGDAEEVAEAIEEAYAKQEVVLFNAQKRVFEKQSQIDEKEKELADAEAAVIVPEEAAKAVVDAYAAAVEAEAAVVAVIEKYEEFLEEEGITPSKSYYRVECEDEDHNHPDVNYEDLQPKALVDKNNDTYPDKEILSNGVFGETYAWEWYNWTRVNIADNFVENYEKDVLKEMDELTDAKYTFDAINEWMKDPVAAETAMRAAVDSLNAQIAVVVAAYDAYDEAVAAADEAEAAVIALEAERDALYNMYYSNDSMNITQMVQQLESSIATAEETILRAKNGINNAEVQVEIKKQTIANLEAEIEVLQARLDILKGQLDAAVAAQQAE